MSAKTIRHFKIIEKPACRQAGLGGGGIGIISQASFTKLIQRDKINLQMVLIFTQETQKRFAKYINQNTQ